VVFWICNVDISGHSACAVNILPGKTNSETE